MAATEYVWCGSQADKLYRTSGEFTTTMRDSQSIGSVDTSPTGSSWDGTNSPWCGTQGDKLYLQSSNFTSTLKTSYDPGGIGVLMGGISYAWDGGHTPWGQYSSTTSNPDYLRLQSGQFTSTSKDTQTIDIASFVISDISWDGSNTPYAYNDSSATEYKMFLQSGQFTSTVLASTDTDTFTAGVRGISISWPTTHAGRPHTPICGPDNSFTQKLWLTSGQFSTTIKTSVDVDSIDNSVQGMESDELELQPAALGAATSTYMGHGDNRFFKFSGQITSTVKTSEDTNPLVDCAGISFNGTDTLWTPHAASFDKTYLTSGDFTTTLKDSQSVPVTGTNGNEGISHDAGGGNTLFVEEFVSPQGLYYMSGQFDTTIKDSVDISASDTTPKGISFDGINTPWCGDQNDEMFLQSGLFTSTIKDSQLVGNSLQAQDISTDIDGATKNTVVLASNFVKTFSGQFSTTVKFSASEEMFEAYSLNWGALETAEFYLVVHNAFATLPSTSTLTAAASVAETTVTNSGMFTAVREFTSFTTGELLEIEAPANQPVHIYKIWVSENNVDSVEQMQVSIKRTSTVGSGGTAVTTKNLKTGGNTEIRVRYGGSPTLVADPPLHQDSQSNTGGWKFVPTPEERITIRGGSSLVVTMENTITSSSGQVGILFRVL